MSVNMLKELLRERPEAAILLLLLAALTIAAAVIVMMWAEAQFEEDADEFSE